MFETSQHFDSPSESTDDTPTRSGGGTSAEWDALVGPTAAGRWDGIVRPYCPADVLRLRGSIHIEHSLARRGALRLWESLTSAPFVAALGALTGNQAVQQV